MSPINIERHLHSVSRDSTRLQALPTERVDALTVTSFKQQKSSHSSRQQDFMNQA